MKFVFKKISTLLNVAFALILITTALPVTAQAKEKFQVVTTFSILADMAQNIAGDAAEVNSITKFGAEIHNYQPTPGDIRKAYKADLVIWNGMNLELWFEKFFKRLKDVPSVTATDGIPPMSIRGGEYNGLPNPHAWMSADYGMIYVDNIRDALVQHDPENAETYKNNASAYKLKIKAAVAPLSAAFETIPEDARWLTTSEGAFSYLTRDYGLKELYLWPINADSQGTPKQVKDVIDAVREHNIKAVFSESTVSANPAKQVARETGSSYGGVLYVDSLSDASGPVPTYIDLLTVTGSTIVEALSK